MSGTDEFMFDLEDAEYKAALAAFYKWAQQTKLTSISNGTDGEIVAARFKEHVEREKPKLAKKLQRDSTVYEAVAIEWNDEQ